MKSHSAFARPSRHSAAISCLVLLSILGTACAAPQTPPDLSLPDPAHDQTSLQPASGLLPSGFVPNAGQLDPAVAFQGLGFAGGLFFTASEIVLSLSQAPKPAPSPSSAILDSTNESSAQGADIVRIQFLGANPSPNISSQGPLPGKVGFFLGNDPSRWRGRLTVYSSLTYAQLYPGIDLRYENAGGTLKGTYILAPGADPSEIRWRYADDVTVSLDEVTGSLSVKTADGRLLLSERPPLAWQIRLGKRLPVAVRYLVAADSNLSFDIGPHDPALPLTIDPTIAFSTYLGGDGYDSSWDVAVDSEGNVLIAGSNGDAFITKLSSDGQVILYSAIFGGDREDVAKGIALDNTSKAYVTGYTTSTDFPLQNALQEQSGGYYDAFISVVDLAAGTLSFSTYLGGSGYDEGASIQVSPRDEIVVGGFTYSADFPFTQNALDTTLGGAADGFVAVIDASDFALVSNTYFGGSGYDAITDLVLGVDEDIYLAGRTDSSDFSIVNPLQGTFGGGSCWYGVCYDAFISRLSSDGSLLLFSTYLGGSGHDSAKGMAFDGQSNLYVFGETSSLNFPLQNPLQAKGDADSEHGDFFIAKLSQSGDSLLYSTYLGGGSEEQAGGIAVDSSGRAFITGDSKSYCIPLLSRERRPASQDALVVALSPDGQNVDFYSYFRGDNYDHGTAMDIDQYGNLFLVGNTRSTDFPTLYALDLDLSGTQDGFVVKIGNRGPVVLPDHGIYLPYIYHPAPSLGIHGYVNYAGCGLAGIPLELRFFNGTSWSTRATTTTAPDGLFSFLNVPSLAPGQKYYVRYVNSAENENYVSYWETRPLTAYISGASVLLGDFTLENIWLNWPPNGTQPPLPYTFVWDYEHSITNVSFEFDLFDPYETYLTWSTNPLGYIKQYTLTRLPYGFHRGGWYLWYVGLFGPDGGYGTSYWARWICFPSGCTNRAQANSLVPLQESSLRWPEALSRIEGQLP